jgi:mannitol-specific phosphotransferase system IIBC component
LAVRSIEIDTLGAGAKKVAGSFIKGCIVATSRGLADSYKDMFVQSVSHIGITCISRMSVKARGAMWTKAKVTKRKLQKISVHLFDWFKKPISSTAKELDVDAFGPTPQVKRKYDSFQLTSKKGKK